ncbi:MAG: chemotaxis protein CheC [Pseudomonadota bacterium]
MMSSETNDIFSDEEKDILQEIMNIAFGSATADLAEVIDIFVELSVPQIHLIPVGELPDFLKNTIHAYDETVIVDQKFWGDFSGSGLLVLPSRATKEMLMLLADKEPEVSFTKTMATLEKESLVEIGNILIGACVGKLSELLKTFATYSPPRIINGSNVQNAFIKSFDPSQTAIVLKTIFKFEHKDLSGLLLLLANQESIGWLRKALHEFLESYE